MIIKHKNRYILVELSELMDISDKKVQDSVIEQFQNQVGETGRAEINPKIVSKVNDKAFVMRVNRGQERKAILALSFIKSVCNKNQGMYTIKTSGTIRSLLNYSREAYG